MSSRQEALNRLTSDPDWEDVLALEQQLREDNLLKMVQIPIADPAYALKTAYYKGAVEAMTQLWSLRKTVQKTGNSKKGE